MAISRAQLAKELEPGLNALFGLEYGRYEQQHTEIFDEEKSNKAFEEDQMLYGFGNAVVKPEKQGVTFDEAGETYTARYTHETVALAFSISQEAVEDSLYDRLATRYTRALARSMVHTKQIKAAAVLNNSYSSGSPIGDGVSLCNASHPTRVGNQSNILATPADLNETSLEEAIIQIQGFKDERGLRVALTGRKLMIPKELQFVAERLMVTNLRVGTADNDINAIRSMGMIPDGYTVNQFFTDPENWWIKTDCPDGFKYFNRVPVSTKMDGDFDTDNVRYRARERYSFGVSDWRCVFGSGNNAA
jgi:hypothetical protein